ncbi:ABC transporter permease (plasmid) [Arthrobacter sp. zg-Y820]|uniref:ABC transporter permease n=1 Tax=unclassified Arthrobacter TaxID=235627 RepID=UPI001E56C434|nr:MULTISPECIES: ABC transporter permease [unclassified Arthrobacter]MCC9198515.1 ABC transporter permease [Arthrobacter sp. zg-Y820]MDK1281385.1 ABC transporter permease [Arthrobacter sp. zg.Y820]WIB11268.1 ABC transporter permease [Arthrobacter sp. zg-Y820]
MTSTGLTTEPRRSARPKGRILDRARGFVVEYAPQLLLVMLIVVVALINPVTLSTANIVNVLINAVPIAVLALGAMWILISGGLDLSAGFGVAMCALVIGGGLQQGIPVPLALLYGVLAGLALGLINGILVGVLAMPPFIATLATMAGVQGMVLLLGTQGTVIVNADILSFIGGARPMGIPMLVILAVLIAAVVAAVARYTRFGLYTYGLGSNRDAMVARGVPIVRQTVLVYMFGGLLVALTAIILVAKVQIVDTNISNISLLLDAFAATIIGGTSLFGGKGTVRGTLTGALIISLISTNLVVIGVSAENIDLFKGITIVVAVIIDAGIRFLEKRRAA